MMTIDTVVMDDDGTAKLTTDTGHVINIAARIPLNMQPSTLTFPDNLSDKQKLDLVAASTLNYVADLSDRIHILEGRLEAMTAFLRGLSALGAKGAPAGPVIQASELLIEPSA